MYYLFRYIINTSFWINPPPPPTHTPIMQLLIRERLRARHCSYRIVFSIPQSSVEVKNELSSTSTPPIRLHGMDRNNLPSSSSVVYRCAVGCSEWRSVKEWKLASLLALISDSRHILVA